MDGQSKFIGGNKMAKKSTKFPHLLSPGKIGNLELKNRVVMGPTETLYATSDGEITDKIIDFYTARAKGGCGLITVHSAQGATKIDKIDPYPGSIRVDDNMYIPMMAELTEAIHRYGAKCTINISAGGGAQSLGFPYDKGSQGVYTETRVAPGTLPSRFVNAPVRPLTVDEIHTMVDCMGWSCLNAKRAGFDAVTIHAIGGYLISEFLTPWFNNRTDEYGGSLENRYRVLHEIIENIQSKCGKDFPIIVRMSIDEYLGDEGRGVEESKTLCQWMERDGVAAIDCEAAVFESVEWMIPTIYQPKATLAHLSAAIKSVVNIPVFAQGRMFDPEVAEQVLADGQADFISESREWIVEPNFVKKLENDDVDGLRRCLNCNYCIGKRVFGQLPLRCTFNPIAGRESRFPNGNVGKAEYPRKVAIIGAGPAGLEAAYIAGQRGHSVDLYEATDRICGGQLRIAASSPCKDILMHIPDFFSVQLARMDNVRIHLNTPITEKNAEDIDADTVLVCTGAEPLIPEIPGIHADAIATAQDVLLKKREVSGHVVICGGGQVGVETALELLERGCAVTIIEMLPDLILKEELMTRIVMMKKLAAANVEILCQHQINGFTAEGVKATDLQSGEEKTIPADHVVLAFGTKSVNGVQDLFEDKDVVVIGDARTPDTITTAINDGFFAALDI